jgi:hypothetical protein
VSNTVGEKQFLPTEWHFKPLKSCIKVQVSLIAKLPNWQKQQIYLDVLPMPSLVVVTLKKRLRPWSEVVLGVLAKL